MELIMKKTLTPVILLAALSGCGSESKEKKVKPEDKFNQPTYLNTAYTGSGEGQNLYNLCVKKEKNDADKYLMEMISINAYNVSPPDSIDCNDLTKKMLKKESVSFLLIRENESLDFSVLAPIKNLKKYGFFDAEFFRMKNIESLKYVKHFRFYRTGGGNLPIDFSEVLKAPALESISFSIFAGDTITDLNPFKNATQIKFFGLNNDIEHDDESKEIFRNDVKITKENCPIDAKSQAITSFCKEYSI